MWFNPNNSKSLSDISYISRVFIWLYISMVTGAFQRDKLESLFIKDIKCIVRIPAKETVDAELALLDHDM